MPGTLRLLPLVLLLPGAALAADAGALCPAGGFPAIPPITPPPDERIHIAADEAGLVREGVSRLAGHVVVRREQLQLEAEQVDYDYLTGHLDARDRVRLLAPGLLITGNRITADLKTTRADVFRAAYFTTERANGEARQLHLDGPKRLDLHAATFTTCDPQNPSWQLGAGRIHLDLDSRQGTARNVVLRVADTPVFWLPWMRFPIGDKRLTGLLFPTFGNSAKHGIQIQAPFYWNIAPNYDATFTPWYMEKRGTLLRSEFRYLHRNNGGQLDADWLGNDRLRGTERWGVHWQHRGRPARGWQTEVDYGKVSDSDYFADFGTGLNVTSTTHLQQRAALNWTGDHWEASLLAQAFQTINGSNSYERLPQLRFQSHLPERNRRLHFALGGEWVRFAHPDDVVRGDRFDLHPVVSLPVRAPAGFLVPKLGWRYTRYDLEAVSPGQPARIERSLPTASLDSGLFFERETGGGRIQTLEPRLFYVYTPYRDQSAIPVFDTRYRPFGINEPVRENFFDGVDRIEDANRLTALLTSRWLDSHSGRERLLVSLGQIWFFADRRVTLPGEPVATGARSNLIARATYRPDDRWYLAGDLAWNPDVDDFDTYNLRVAWTRDGDHQAHLDYRNTRDRLETAEAGFAWRLSPRWRLDGRYLQDLRAAHALEKILGIRYDSCCWALGLQGRERFISDTVEPERGVYFEIELKGLSSVGTHY